VVSGDETITVDTLGLVKPQLDKVIGFLDGLGLGDEETLENVGQMTHIELIMEVEGGLSEGGLNTAVEGQSRLDDGGDQLLDGALELAEVLVQEGSEDGVQGGLLGEWNGNNPEPSLETGVNKEGTGSRVHGRDVHGVLDVTDGPLGSTFVPMLVILVLSKERNGSLGLVGILLGHVQVINKLKHLELTERSEGLTSLLLELGLKLLLEEARIGVVVEVDGLRKVVITGGGHVVEETLGDLGLTATGGTDEQG